MFGVYKLKLLEEEPAGIRAEVHLTEAVCGGAGLELSEEEGVWQEDGEDSIPDRWVECIHFPW